ncbi:MAG: hypothetical protein MRY83_05970, partial [Flavobacteriales bacterium]|nr:hypothetical protein [Flavobacteriales bacterium]
RQGLSVQTWDLYEHILGADASKYNRLLSIGGDGYEDGPDEGEKQNRFKPVLKVLGPFELQPGQSKKHVIKMPNYIGAVRTMVVAKNDKAYGSVEKSTPVKKPLMVLGTLPRVLGPDEEITLPVTTFALEDYVKDVTITVEGNGFLEVQGEKTKKVSFSDIGDRLTNFSMKVGQRLGTGQVKVTAKSGKEKAVYWVDVEVRSPNPPVVDVYDGAVAANGNWSKDFALNGMPGSHSATLELSSIQPINMDKRLKYLIQYPHGCVEQTTSSVFPQLFVSNLIKLDGKKRQEIDRNVRAGIKRLTKFQTSEGGLAYWPGGYSSNEWGTNYAGHFILEAKKRGYRVPNSFLNNWKEYQKKKARMWLDGSNGDQLTQAYRLYLLAYHGEPEMGAMNRMRLKTGLNNTAKWYLAAAYELASNSNVANDIAKTANLEVTSYRELSGTYGTDLRDKAIILHACALLGKDNLSQGLAKKLSDQLAADKWYSTQTTAYTLYALTKFYEGRSADQVFAFEYKIGDGSWQSASSNKFITHVRFKDSELKAGKISIRNKSGKELFAKWNVQSTPLPGKEESASNNMELAISYYTTEGESLDPSNLEQGQDFIAEVRINNTSPEMLEEMALTQIFPSGWEIHNSRLDGDGYMGPGDRPTYMDIRDDRVYSYFDLSKGSSKTFKVMLNAAYLGKYYLPAVSCEAMYDESINAREKGQWVNVVKGGAL